MVMQERALEQATGMRNPLEESRGGWAFFGRLLVWSTRNNRAST
jgi:hypothetical protein